MHALSCLVAASHEEIPQQCFHVVRVKSSPYMPCGDGGPPVLLILSGHPAMPPYWLMAGKLGTLSSLRKTNLLREGNSSNCCCCSAS